MSVVKYLKEIFYKNQSFKGIVYIYLTFEAIEILASLLFLSTPIGLLFPVFLYVLLLSLKRGKVSMLNYWYMLLPFVIYSLLYLYLFFIASLSNGITIWRMCYLPFYVTFLLYFIITVFTGCYDCFKSRVTNKFLLIRQLNLLLTMHLGIVCTLIYLQVTTGNYSEFIIKDRIWIMLLFLFTGMLLKINYLYKEKNDTSNEKQIASYPKEKVEEYIKILIRLFEEDKIYLRHDLDSKVLSKVSKIAKSDLNYLFKYYIKVEFRMFVAEYRIAYALELIQKKGNIYTLEAIANQSGYKYLTTFNRYFFLITDVTPSDYLNMNNSQIPYATKSLEETD